MIRFRKAIAILILILFVVQFIISAFIQKDNGSTVRERKFGDYVVTFIVGAPPPTKQPLVGNQIFFGYGFETLKREEIEGIYYLSGKEFEIRKDDKIVNNNEDFRKYFKDKKRAPNAVAGYTFSEPGIYKIISNFEHNGKIVTTEFSLEVKTKERYEEESVKGTLIIIFSFILVVIFAIYLYEKLEEPKKKGKSK